MSSTEKVFSMPIEKPMEVYWPALYRFSLWISLLAAWVAGLEAQASPLEIISISPGPELSIRSEIGVTNEILFSDDLRTSNWTVMARFLVSQSPYHWPDNSDQLPRQRFYRVHMPLPRGMVLVPAGLFEMGDAFKEGSNDEQPVHTAYVNGFYADASEVTKEQWDEVKVWSFANGYSYDRAGSGKAANHPVHSINWYDAVKWCNARSQKEGRTPVYYEDQNLARVYRAGRVEPFVDWTATGYRLPTEAEWEKAARGGLRARRFPWGDTITHAEANYTSRTNETYDVSGSRGGHPQYSSGAPPHTSPAGSFPANRYGACDMSGNVWEWCWDWLGDYSAEPLPNPRGPMTGTKRINRGGSWYANADGCRVSDRSGLSPTNTYDTLGFRTVLPLGP